jgi:hypothetical protein
LTPDDPDPNHIEDTDMKKVEALKKAVAEGKYAVSAEDLAPKIMELMFRNTIFDETSNRTSGFQLEAGVQFNLQNNDRLKIPGGALVNHKDSRSVSASSNGSHAGPAPERSQ